MNEFFESLPFIFLFSESNINSYKMETKSKMKKISPKLISIALILLSLLVTGGFLAKNVIGPSGGGSTGGWEPEPNPDGG